MTVTFEQRQTAERIVRETAEKFGYPYEIKIEWRAFTSKLGDAHSGYHRIRFSTKFWPHMPEAKRINTAVHEACHLVADWKFGYAAKPHGREWKSLMRQCGEDSSATWNLNQSAQEAGLGRKRHAKNYVTICGCGEHPITQNRWTRMQRGTRYRCRTCKQSLRAA